MIDWVEAVQEYKKEYDDDLHIMDYVDSLVPIYYYDILGVFGSYNLANTYIESHHEGLPIWQVMTQFIFEEYLNAFMNEWEPFDEEE